MSGPDSSHELREAQPTAFPRRDPEGRRRVAGTRLQDEARGDRSEI